MDQMEAAGLPGPMTLGGTTLPLVGRARVYACGITPYDVTHVGHAAAFVWVDTLARVLHELLGQPNVKNYDGSWTEYGSLVGVPIELGEAR